MLFQLSPVKSGTRTDKKYFTGKLTDGQKVTRVISFEPKLHDKCEQFKKERKALALVNCTIKQSKYDDGMEVIASLKTKLELSPKRFKIDQDLYMLKEESIPPEITLSQLQDVDILVTPKVSVSGKIVKVHEPNSVMSLKKNKLLNKQDCIIADNTGTAKIVLWENKIGLLKLGMSYKLMQLAVSSFRDLNNLNLQEDAKIEEIDINVNVEDAELSLHDEQNDMINGEIAVVLSTKVHIACVNCKGEVQPSPKSCTIGECIECKAKMKMAKCLKIYNANFVFEDDKGKSWYLTAFNEQIIDILNGTCMDGKDLGDELLAVPPMKLVVSNENIVKEVVRI